MTKSTEDISYSEIDVVNVVDIKFAPYQRSRSQEHINFLARYWDDDKCDPITVSLRKDGDLFVIDGMHRVLAAMKAGVKELFARVLKGMSYEQEADYFFNAQRSRRGMSAQDAWNASLEAKHPETVEINSIVHSLGGKVNKSADQDRGINCPTRLWRIHEAAGQKVLYDLLDIINDAWDDYKLGGVATEAPMLSGMMFFVFYHQKDGKKSYKRARLVKNLKAVGPLKVRELGRRWKDMGRKQDDGFYLAILDVYNKGLVESSRIEAKKVDWRSVKATTRKSKAEAAYIRKTTR